MSAESRQKIVSVIVPAFNEEKSISRVIADIKALGKDYEIIVVDDGSQDNTAAICKDLGIKVIRNPYNIGLGGSLKRGVCAAKGEIVVFLDGDGQHPPHKIPELVSYLDEYDMVVGARDFSQQKYHRAFGNWMLEKTAQTISGYKIPDLTTGFRALKKKYYMEFIHLLPNGFSSATTITLAMLQAGLFVKFVNIPEITTRTAGKSKIRFLNDGLFFLKIIIRIIMLFNPMKIFLPVSVVFGVIGVSMSTYDIVGFNNLQESSVLMVILSAVIFSFGVMADYMSHLRRDIGLSKDNNRYNSADLD